MSLSQRIESLAGRLATEVKKKADSAWVTTNFASINDPRLTAMGGGATSSTITAEDWSPNTTHAGQRIEVNRASDMTVTFPTHTEVAIPVNTKIDFLIVNTGRAGFRGKTGVTVNGTPGRMSNGQWSWVSAVKRANNVWVVYGALNNTSVPDYVEEPPPSGSVIFSDNFNRADGVLTTPWWHESNTSFISGNQVTSDSWATRVLVDISRSSGYRVSMKVSKREWPIMLARFVSGADYYGVAWSNPNYELLRRVGDSDAVIDTMPSPTSTTRTMWAEFREMGGATEIKWGYDTTSKTFTDSTANRPAGTYVGMQTQPGIMYDDFLVEEL